MSGGGLGVAKILNIGIFKMQPIIVVMLVLGTPEHLELGPNFKYDLLYAMVIFGLIIF